MATVTISDLAKTFRRRGRGVRALDAVDVEVQSGELLVLLGPSGSGKTTLMRCVAGMERPDTGRITLDERPVWDAATRCDVAPNKRGVGMVFQNYALWPHMTVNANVGYPLRVQRRKRELAEGRVDEILEVVGCGELGERFPAELSGGQQQRVALARALVARPKVLLFDEPLSNIDTQVRLALREEIARLHTELGFTGIYVTHDQSEALVLGTKVAVMRRGRIEQVGAPDHVYRNPANEEVAKFLGARNAIALAGSNRPSNLSPLIERLVGARAQTEDSVIVRWRPEVTEVSLNGRPQRSAEGGLIELGSGVVATESYGGDWREYVIELDAMRVVARRQAWEEQLATGTRVNVYTHAQDLLVYDKGDLVV